MRAVVRCLKLGERGTEEQRVWLEERVKRAWGCNVFSVTAAGVRFRVDVRGGDD